MPPDPIAPETPSSPPNPLSASPSPMSGVTSNIIHPDAPAVPGRIASFPVGSAEPAAPAQTPFQPAPQVPKPFVPPTPQELQEASTSGPQPGMVMPSAPGEIAAGSPAHNNSSPPKKKKRMVLIGVAAALVVLIGGGAVFGLYLPNQPGNVWNTGLDRSGKALGMVYDKVSTQGQLDAFKKTEVTLNTNISASGALVTGNADFKFDSSKSTGTVDFSFTDSASGSKKQTGSLNFIANTPANSLIPDLYFQLNGLKLLNADDLFPGISAYDGKWISADHTYLSSLYPADSQSLNSKVNLTAADYKELAKAAIDTTNQYVLTSNNNRAVLAKKSFVGKEKTDGLSTYHYKAGINKTHAKDYCKAIVTNVMSTAAYKKLPFVDKSKIDSEKNTTVKACQDSIDKDVKDSDQFDVWVDAKYKLIYKIRVYANNKIDYTDFGQTYKGGDDVSLFLTAHEDKSKTDMKFIIGLNTKTNATKGSFAYVSKGDSPSTISLSMEAKPFTGEIKADKPAGAISLQEVLKKFGLDPAAVGGLGSGTDLSAGSSSSGSETDVYFITASLEDYFAAHKGYPILNGQLNNDSWVTANLSNAVLDDFRADGQTKNSMVSTTKPTVTQYGYIALKGDGVTVCSVSPCAKYKLYYLDGQGMLQTKSNSDHTSTN